MEKSDLKDGMYVKLRNGEFAEYYKGYLLVFEQKGVRHIDNYIYDLTYTINKEMDIIEVLDESKNIIWQRKEMDWDKVIPGTKVLVSDNGKNWYKHYFIRYETESEKFRAINDLKAIHIWNYCKLAEDTKEVTYEELAKGFKDFCDNNSCPSCKYEIKENCKFNYVLGNYNLTRK